MSRRHYGPCSWFALLATLGSLLSPAATLAENRAITLQGDGGDAWTFEKEIAGELPDGGCHAAGQTSPANPVRALRRGSGRPVPRRLGGQIRRMRPALQ
jgi:hypothetical protein